MKSWRFMIIIISLPWKTGENETFQFWVLTQSYFHKKKINQGRLVCWDELAQQWNITIVNRIAFVDKCLSKPIQNRSCKLTKLKQSILELKGMWLKKVEKRALKLSFLLEDNLKIAHWRVRAKGLIVKRTRHLFIRKLVNNIMIFHKQWL